MIYRQIIDYKKKANNFDKMEQFKWAEKVLGAGSEKAGK